MASHGVTRYMKISFSVNFYLFISLGVYSHFAVTGLTEGVSAIMS